MSDEVTDIDAGTGQLVLSLFPGIGLLDMAFEQTGFCVVRGPDVLWGGDIRRFRTPQDKFDGIIGGPPCQAFSSLAHLVRANGHEPKFGNLIPEFERVVSESQAFWFLMENVRGAPEPKIENYTVVSFLLNNAWIPGDDGFGQEQERLRRFSYGVLGDTGKDLRRWIRPAALMLMERSPTQTQWTPDNSPEAKRRTASIIGEPIGIKRGAEEERERRPERYRRQAVVSSTDPVPVKIGGSCKIKRTRAMFGDGRPTRKEHRHPALTGNVGGMRRTNRYTFAEACRLQGLPEDFLEQAPFRADAKLQAVANGVPLPMGLAVAKAVRCAIDEWTSDIVQRNEP